MCARRARASELSTLYALPTTLSSTLYPPLPSTLYPLRLLIPFLLLIPSLPTGFLCRGSDENRRSPQATWPLLTSFPTSFFCRFSTRYLTLRTTRSHGSSPCTRGWACRTQTCGACSRELHTMMMMMMIGTGWVSTRRQETRLNERRSSSRRPSIIEVRTPRRSHGTAGGEGGIGSWMTSCTEYVIYGVVLI